MEKIIKKLEKVKKELLEKGFVSAAEKIQESINEIQNMPQAYIMKPGQMVPDKKK